MKTTVGDQREDHDDPNYAEAPPPANPNDVGIEMQGGKDIEGGGDSPPGTHPAPNRRVPSHGIGSASGRARGWSPGRAD